MSDRSPIARPRRGAWLPALLLVVGGLPVGCGSAPSSVPTSDGTPGVIRTGERIHIVRRGETFGAISRLYGIPQDTLRRANPTVPPERLPLGTELRIPSRKPEVRNVEGSGSP